MAQVTTDQGRLFFNAKFLKAALIAACFLLAMFVGVEWIFGRFKAVPFLLPVLLGITVTNLIWLDSRVRGRPIPLTVLWLVVIAWPVVLPIYYGRTRGWKGIVKGLVFIGLLFVTSALASAGSYYVLAEIAYKTHTGGDYRRAVQYYKRLLEVVPEDDWAKENLEEALRSAEENSN